jgi:hypothetical protein
MEIVTNSQNHKRSPLLYGNKTHCINGHEFTPENRLTRKNRPRGECRICHRIQERERKRLAR